MPATSNRLSPSERANAIKLDVTIPRDTVRELREQIANAIRDAQLDAHVEANADIDERVRARVAELTHTAETASAPAAGSPATAPTNSAPVTPAAGVDVARNGASGAAGSVSAEPIAPPPETMSLASATDVREAGGGASFEVLHVLNHETPAPRIRVNSATLDERDPFTVPTVERVRQIVDDETDALRTAVVVLARLGRPLASTLSEADQRVLDQAIERYGAKVDGGGETFEAWARRQLEKLAVLTSDSRVLDLVTRAVRGEIDTPLAYEIKRLHGRIDELSARSPAPKKSGKHVMCSWDGCIEFRVPPLLHCAEHTRRFAEFLNDPANFAAQRESFARGNLAIDRAPDSRRTVEDMPRGARATEEAEDALLSRLHDELCANASYRASYDAFRRAVDRARSRVALSRGERREAGGLAVDDDPWTCKFCGAVGKTAADVGPGGYEEHWRACPKGRFGKASAPASVERDEALSRALVDAVLGAACSHGFVKPVDESTFVQTIERAVNGILADRLAPPAPSSASVHVSACKISDDDIAASFGVTPKNDGGAG